MAPQTSRSLGILYVVLVLTGVGVFLFNLISALNTIRSTSVLSVSTQNENSIITISQAGKQAKLLGSGSTKSRLSPGKYYVTATSNGTTASRLVQISLDKDVAISLSPKKDIPQTLPSAADIGFINLDLLLDSGLSSTQLTNMKQLFFTYKPSAGLVTIDPESILSGSRDRNSVDINSSLSFSGKVDSTPYSATLVYNGYENVSLSLTDPATSKPIFSGILPESFGD